MQSAVERNHAIDSLRLICAFLIVVLHSKAEGWGGGMPITRCAVPIFFMISGYLMTINGFGISKKIVKSMKNVFWLVLWSSLFFLIFKESLFFVKEKSFFLPSLSQLGDFLLFNENPFGYHLWYLSAYLYVLAILFVVSKLNLWKFVMGVVPFLLLVDLMMGKYSMLFFDRIFPYVWVRNFLFVGLPYTLLGVFLRKVELYVDFEKKKIFFLVGIFLFCIASVVEKQMLLYLNLDTPREHFISTTFLSICVFSFCLSICQKKSNFLSSFGKSYSLMIYIIHPFLLFFVKSCSHMELFVHNSIGKIFSFFIPIVTFVASIVFSICFYKVKNAFRANRTAK